jgi:subtilisin family serine protease
VLYSAFNSFDTTLPAVRREERIVDKTPNNSHEFIAASGTSMSSPMVAGIVALMLEKKPNLTQTEIKEIIRITAINDQ